MSDQHIPRNAKVVVVGGGIVGCSIAYHLTKIGIPDVVLLERKRLTSGTTWHAAGIIGRLRPSATLTELLRYAINIFRSLEDEVGQSIGFKQNGAVFLALSTARLEIVRRMVSYAGSFGVEAHMLSIEELTERWPLLCTDGINGAAFVSGYGQVNPIDATNALARKAKASGATILEGINVSRILTKNGRAVGVETPFGEIEANLIVLACGMWTRELAASIGVNVPLHAAEHFYLLTEPIDQLRPNTPVLISGDERAYFKEDAGKLLIGAYEKSGRPWGSNGIPELFEFGSLPVDLEPYTDFLEVISRRVPILANTGVRTFFVGPESFTPDGRPLVGESPEVRKLFVCAGFHSAGIMWSLGVGNAMANWIRDGYPSLGISSFDIQRMMPFQGNRRFLYDRIKETLALPVDMPWPGRQMESARGVRRSPIHRELIEVGAQMGEVSGWELPLWFSQRGIMTKVSQKLGRQDWFPAVSEECRAVSDAVAFQDRSHQAKILVQGADACRFLNWLSVGNVDVPQGQAFYTYWLNSRGGIVSDPLIMRVEDTAFMIITSRLSQTRDLTWLRQHLSNDSRVSLTDMTAAYALFGLIGPKSSELLQRITDADLSDSAFPIGKTSEINLGYVTVRATRLPHCSEVGFTILIGSDVAIYVYEQIQQAGSDLGLRHAGQNALHSLCLERGSPRLGLAISEETTLLEAGLGASIPWAKFGCFLGQDALQRERMKGPTRSRIVNVRLADSSNSAPILEQTEPIWRDNVRVGTMACGGWGFRLHASLGMGYLTKSSGVSSDWLSVGRYEVEIAMERHPARVQELPFM